MDVVKEMKNQQQKTDPKKIAEQPKEKIGAEKNTEVAKTISQEDKIELGEKRSIY